MERSEVSGVWRPVYRLGGLTLKLARSFAVSSQGLTGFWRGEYTGLIE